MGESSETTARSRAGRKPGIDDEYLGGTRDSLVWLLENTWGEVGWNVRTIKTPADVSRALQSWEQHRDKYVVVALLRPSDHPATAKTLNAMRRRLARLNESVRTAYEFHLKRKESLDRAERAMAQSTSQDEKELIAAEREKRLQAFRSAEAEHLAANGRREKLEQQLRDGEAHFARTEFVRFCKSRRYTLNPLNTANALAGLPFIGWRQSAKRCKKWESANANGYTFQVFNNIRRMVDSCPSRTELVGHAEQWLRSKRSSDPYAISQLRQNWYYLRRAIESVLKSKPPQRALPYLLSSEYLRKTTVRTAVDLLFEEEERIECVAPAPLRSPGAH
jgi:hypothetical protein